MAGEAEEVAAAGTGRPNHLQLNQHSPRDPRRAEQNWPQEDNPTEAQQTKGTSAEPEAETQTACKAYMA